jgi:hypothetical protein
MPVFDTVRGLVDKWATTNGFKGVEFTLSYRGTVSQEVIGPALMRKGLLERFQAELQGHSAIPSQPLTLDLQTVRVQVNLSDGKRMRTSDGIQGTESLASSLVPTYESHVAHKAKSAAKHGATPFALVYIQTPGTGMSDFKTSSIFGMAISRVFARDSNLMNKADTLWLGAVLLDYRHEIPKTTCFLRPNAGWPDGLSPDRFAHGLKGSLTLI